MIANYHTHTPRCHHAVGREEEYIQNAIAHGMKTLGFSDHSPYLFPDGYVSTFRMLPEEMDGYVQTVLELKERYKEQIDLHLGLELEYYPKFFGELLEFFKDYPLEYVILGQHYTNSEVDGFYSGRATDDEAVLRQYCLQVCQALNTGVFTYLAHPDLIHFTGSTNVYRRHLRQICREAKSCGIPLEINMLGLKAGRNYPDRRFWEMAAEEGCSVILGCDAHEPKALNDPETERRALALANEFSLPVLEKTDFRYF